MQLSHYILMIVPVALVLGVALAFSRVTKYWAFHIVKSETDPSFPLTDMGRRGTGRVQDALTPPWLTLLLLVSFLLTFLITGLGIYFLGWKRGLIGFLGLYICAGVVSRILPKSSSEFHHGWLISSLRSRQRSFEAAGDSLRVEGMQHFISTLETLAHG
jgi:hypothetical protein